MMNSRATMACQSLTCDSGVDSTVSIGPIDASNAIEGEHLTQAEYQTRMYLQALQDAQESDRRIALAKADYELEQRRTALSVQAMGLALTAKMLNGMVDHLRSR